MGLLRRDAEEPEDEFLVVVDQAVDPFLVLFTDPRGPEAEQYRGLRNHVVTMNPEGAPRTIAVTSAVAGEGKSTATLNLAMALAERPDTRVVVVDADLHQPSLEGLLGMNRRRGLSEVLRGRYTLDRAVHRTAYNNLHIIGAGAVPENPSEMLATERMPMVLNALKENFNYILVDSPPALEITDASTLGRIADGVLVVVRLEHTARGDVDRTLAILQNLGSNILGTFLVGARASKKKRRYSYGQG